MSSYWKGIGTPSKALLLLLLLQWVNCGVSDKLVLTGSVGKCGETTRLTCASDDIQPGEPFTFYKLNPVKTVTDNVHNNKTVNGKYRASSGNGDITLDIYQTNNDDAGEYQCNHGPEDSNVLHVPRCSNSGPPSSDVNTFLFLIVVLLGLVIVKGMM